MPAKYIVTCVFKKNKRERIVSTFHETDLDVLVFKKAMEESNVSNYLRYIYVSEIIERQTIFQRKGR